MLTFKRVFGAFAVSMLLMNGCGGPEPEPTPPPTPPTPAKVAVSEVSLNKTSVTITEGGTETLTATVSPTDATEKRVNWSSSDASVVSVDGNGMLTAVKVGSATITVSTVDGGKTANCRVTVEAKVIPVTGVSLNAETLEVVEGDVIPLQATVSPEDASEKAVVWSASDMSLVSLESDGLTAIGSGNVTITVTTKDGGKTASCEVTIKPKVIHLERLEISNESLTIRANWSEPIWVSFYPANAEDQTVTWISTDESVAWPRPRPNQPEVCDVQAVNPGEADIIAISNDGGKTAHCKVTVTPIPLKRVSLQMSSMLVYVGQEIQWDVYFDPPEATNKKVTWKVADPSIASVDQNGVIKGLAPGDTKVSIVSEDGGLTSEHDVMVREVTIKVNSIKLDKTTLSMASGTDETLTAILSPSNATNKDVIWLSSDLNVAWVSANGVVSAKNPGTCDITAISSDGRFKATCKVTVGASPSGKVSGVRLGNSEITLNVGGNATLYATISPSTATNMGLTWTSSDPSVAKVDNHGKVTAVKVGSAVITVKTADGGYTDKCTVKVQTQVVHAQKVTLDKTSVTLNVNSKVRLNATISPSNVTNPNLVWKSDNTSVAKVDANGMVTAVGPGTTRIIVSTVDNGSAAICVVTVKRFVGGISISGQNSVSVYSSIHLTATVSPSNASNSEVSWSSSNTAVATVDQSGNVKGIKEGKVTISATARDGGGAVGTFQVTVTKAVTTYLMLSDSYIEVSNTLEMLVGEYLSFGVVPYPREHRPTVTWTCSNNEIVEVQDYMNQQYTRLLYAKKAGTCTITLKAQDSGGAARTFKIVVKQQ